MNDTLLPGYGLVRKKGMVVHVGTYIGMDRVVHINPKGLKIESVKAFASGSQVGIVKNEVSIPHLSQRLDQVLREKAAYDPLAWNCEHLANFLQKGVQESPQLVGAALGLTVGIGAVKAGKMGAAGTFATLFAFTWLGSQIAGPSVM